MRTLLIPRPAGPRAHLPPIKIVLFFDGPPASLSAASEVILDFPGGGFICMGPGCHEERLRYWARRFGRGRKEGTGRRIVVSVDYGKSPECASWPVAPSWPPSDDQADPPRLALSLLLRADPYPWAIDECFDLYLAVVRSNGAVLGLAPAGGTEVELVLTGDSACVPFLPRPRSLLPERRTLTLLRLTPDGSGANIVCTVLFSLLESPLGEGVRRPKAIVLAYAALDFNFTCECRGLDSSPARPSRCMDADRRLPLDGFCRTAWMSQENLRVLREETGVKRRTASGADLSGLEQSKDHLVSCARSSARCSPSRSLTSARPPFALRRPTGRPSPSCTICRPGARSSAPSRGRRWRLVSERR